MVQWIKSSSTQSSIAIVILKDTEALGGPRKGWRNSSVLCFGMGDVILKPCKGKEKE
jgi:hypothetical protein